jgi:hypothetical protein
MKKSAFNNIYKLIQNQSQATKQLKNSANLLQAVIQNHDASAASQNLETVSKI